MPRYKLPMPSEFRVRSCYRSNFLQDLSPQDLPFDAQATPLVIVEQNSLLSRFPPEHSILGYEVGEHILFATIHPTRQN
jgi:hypothetical protein